MIEFTFPSQIGPFKKGRVVSHEARHPGAGYGIAYHGNIADEATVYVYDNRLDSIPSDPMDEIVLGEFQATMRDIHQHYASQGVAPELVGQYGTGSPSRGLEFLCAEFLIPSTSTRTFLYVTGAYNQFVKLRVSYRDRGEADPTARNFADQVAEILWAKRDAGSPSAQEPTPSARSSVSHTNPIQAESPPAVQPIWAPPQDWKPEPVMAPAKQPVQHHLDRPTPEPAPPKRRGFLGWLLGR
ncbi:hypothetical protein ACQVP2_34905 [Methylobacterium aquaticum]|uniref:hypothetical protein n=1 Tax=Methylobacterium aquaticum TaxID=270351 RepID=UPI003D17BE2E